VPIYLVLLIAVVIAVRRATARIAVIEGHEGRREVAPTRGDRWGQAPGVEKAAFIVMAISAAMWTLLILPIGFAAAVVALGVAVWRRPYLEATLAPVVLIGGGAIALYDLLLPLLRDDGDWGASVINTAAFGGLWVLIGVLLLAAGRPRGASSSLPSSPR
jgi:hypothetical protein